MLGDHWDEKVDIWGLGCLVSVVSCSHEFDSLLTALSLGFRVLDWATTF